MQKFNKKTINSQKKHKISILKRADDLRRDMEKLDIIDEKGNLTGESEGRKIVHKLGLRHHACGIIIYNNDKILLQQRSFKKEKNAGLWDITAGHIMAGDKVLPSLAREVKEELGIDIANEKLTLLGKYWRQEIYRQDFTENELDYIYLLEKYIPIEDIKIQESELEQVKYFTIHEFKQLLQEKKATSRIFYQDFFKIIEK